MPNQATLPLLLKQLNLASPSSARELGLSSISHHPGES